MRNSLDIMRQVINKMPSGSVKPTDVKITNPFRTSVKSAMEDLVHHFLFFSDGMELNPGSTYVGIESPKGEFGVYVSSPGQGIIQRCKIRSPGFTHLQSIDFISKNHLIADVVTIIGSFDIVFGEIDR
jgi:NADH-quinone oxidoreductase subunit D